MAKKYRRVARAVRPPQPAHPTPRRIFFRTVTQSALSRCNVMSHHSPGAEHAVSLSDLANYRLGRRGLWRRGNHIECAQRVDSRSAAESAEFGSIELHQSIVKNDVASMVPKKSVTIPPAGGKVEFRPNGCHLMMLAPTKPLRAGQQVTVTLK